MTPITLVFQMEKSLVNDPPITLDFRMKIWIFFPIFNWSLRTTKAPRVANNKV